LKVLPNWCNIIILVVAIISAIIYISLICRWIISVIKKNHEATYFDRCLNSKDAGNKTRL
jgi:hypothetical protein